MWNIQSSDSNVYRGATHITFGEDELEWWFNKRDNPYLFGDTLLKLIKSANLEYRALIAK